MNKDKCDMCGKVIKANKIMLHISFKENEFCMLYFCSRGCFLTYLSVGEYKIKDDFVISAESADKVKR
jgi:hypothetical protein